MESMQKIFNDASNDNAIGVDSDHQKQVLLEQLDKLAAENLSLQRRVSAVIQLNHEIMDLEDEKSLVERALESLLGLAGAESGSFVPVDELGQPLPAMVLGNLPEKAVKVWSEHLASPEVRERCAACLDLEAEKECILLTGPFADKYRIYCFQIRQTGRLLGIVNLYLWMDHSIDREARIFINSLLDEMALAMQTVRLRNQRMATLKQIQWSGLGQAEFKKALADLVNGFQQALNLDCVILDVPENGGLEAIELAAGECTWLNHADFYQIFQKVKQSKKVEMRMPSTDGDAYVVCMPILINTSEVAGFLAAASRSEDLATPREVKIIQTVADQISSLIANGRVMVSMQYHSILQERVRLAREIHDGLAQTLAYLKLQTAQMGQLLESGETQRLSRLLEQNYAALTEAYLDARQVIDNLRLSPAQGLKQWLDQIIREFENNTGFHVERQIEEPQIEIIPEVQAHLVRIVQEAMNNARKHAEASRIWVKIDQQNSQLILEIGDDGKGFSMEDVPIISQHGLRGIRERAAMIGADLQVDSQPQSGTIIRLILPLSQEVK
jgi:two-component system nitrate/nitrite sensor histidine kinase NarX